MINTNNLFQLLTARPRLWKLKNDFQTWNGTQQSLENKIKVIKHRFKELPKEMNLSGYNRLVDDTLARVQKVYTGLLAVMGGYRLSHTTSCAIGKPVD